MVDNFPLEKDTFRKNIEFVEDVVKKKVTTTTANRGNRRGFFV